MNINFETFKNENMNEEISLIHIICIEYDYYFIINTKNFMEMILKEIEETTFLFIDVSPKLKKPILASNNLISSTINFMKEIQKTIQNFDNITTTTLIELKFDNLIDTTILNGWFLNYPFIYIHSNFFENDDSFEHCLNFETLYLIEIYFENEFIKSFSIPLELFNDDMKKKKSGGLFDSNFELESVGDDIKGFKNFIQSEKEFVIEETDALEEKERQKFYDLTKIGKYEFVIESMNSGKFKVELKVTDKKKNTLVSCEKILQGREGQTPAVLYINFYDKSSFFKKASYSFKCQAISDDIIDFDSTSSPKVQTGGMIGPLKPATLEDVFEIEKNQKLQVQIYLVDENEKVNTMVHKNESYSKLMKSLTEKYGIKTLKYTDNENEKATIRSDEELQVFFTNIKPGVIPKLYLQSPTAGGSGSFTISSPTNSIVHSLPQNVLKTPTSEKPNSEDGKNIFILPENDRKHSAPSTVLSEDKPHYVKKWQKGKLLGAGAFAKVYKALDQDTGKLIAVKQVDLKGINYTEEKFKALESEILLLSTLNHENIVRYLGMERNEKYLNIFLDFIPGGSIENVYGDFELSEEVVKNYTKQILEGLIYLHSKNILHRDIKAANILLDNNGQVYLSDFGASKKLTNQIKKEKILEGTPNYMSPEVISQCKYTKYADIYALGCTVLEMLTRAVPWSDVLNNFDNPYSFFEWRREKDPRLEIPKNLSNHARSFIQACVQDFPENRPSAEQLLNHVFITGKDDLDEDYGEDDVKPKELVEPKQKYINDGFEFDDIDKDGGYVSPKDPFSSDDEDDKQERSPVKKNGNIDQPKKNYSLGFDDLLEGSNDDDDEDFI
eukprot:gene2467-3177_t